MRTGREFCSHESAGALTAGIVVFVALLASSPTLLPRAGAGVGAIPGDQTVGGPAAQSTLGSPPRTVAGGTTGPSGSHQGGGRPTSNIVVTFQETGLLAGTTWTVFMNGQVSSNATTVVFTEPPGYYYFEIASVGDQVPTPSSGELNVTGPPVFVSVTFQSGYPVVFIAEGLPSGTQWIASLSGTDLIGGSTNDTVVIDAGNGSYNYTAFTLASCWSSPPSGSLTVDGGPVVLFLRFTAVEFPVTFFQSGLPAGTNWSVWFAGVLHPGQARGGAIRFSATCGDYLFEVGEVPGYSWINPLPYAQIQVDGPTSYEVGFEPKTGFLSLPGDTGYYVVALLAGFAAALVAAGVFVRTRAPKRP